MHDDKDWVEVWFDLTVPALSETRDAALVQRDALRARIVAQQIEVMASLSSLGAVEAGRVQLLRNAIAVRMPREQIDAGRLIPGIRAVRIVRHIERDPPNPKR